MTYVVEVEFIPVHHRPSVRVVFVNCPSMDEALRRFREQWWGQAMQNYGVDRLTITKIQGVDDMSDMRDE